MPTYVDPETKLLSKLKDELVRLGDEIDKPSGESAEARPEAAIVLYSDGRVTLFGGQKLQNLEYVAVRSREDSAGTSEGAGSERRLNALEGSHPPPCNADEVEVEINGSRVCVRVR